MSGLSIIQVGVGLWGRSWAELVASAPKLELAAVVDGARAARDWGRTTLRVPVFGRLEQALSSVEADAVLLVSPPATHRPLAEASLAAGYHVIVEKPLAPSIADARALAAAARRSNRHVIVAQNYRFRRHSQALRELVRTRTLGRLLGIQVACRRDLRSAWISRHDWRGRMTHPYVLDMAIHHLDLVRAITGREIVEAEARAWRVPDSPFRHEPTVHALMTLEDGTPVAYEGTWATRARETSWNGDWELVGVRARATWTGGVNDALRGTVRLERYGETPVSVKLPTLPAIDRLGVIHELERALATGQPPACSAMDNLRTLAAVFALARSVEERRPVSIREFLGE
jgi:predicted dehydrogenase